MSPNTSPTKHKEPKRGTLKWFDPAKGYGFIVDNTGADIMASAHAFYGNKLEDVLPSPGDIVRYREHVTPRGTRAVAWTIEHA